MNITLITTLPDGSKHYSCEMDAATAVRTLQIMEPKGLKTTVSVDKGRGIAVTYPAKYFVENVEFLLED